MPAYARIGHVNLKVSDLARSLAFYRDVVGLSVTKLIPDQAAFLSLDGYHHDLCINTWFSRSGSPPPEGSTGLYHFAVVFTDRDRLVSRTRHVEDAGVKIDAFVDHGANQSVYFRDPDDNGIELYWDRPENEWYDSSGKLAMKHQPITAEQFFAPLP